MYFKFNTKIPSNRFTFLKVDMRASYQTHTFLTQQLFQELGDLCPVFQQSFGIFGIVLPVLE